MKNLIILLVVILNNNYSHAIESRRRAPYTIGESKLSKKLKVTESVFDFTFYGLDNDSLQKVRYSIDNGKEFLSALVNNKFSIKTKPGKHKFMILYGENYAEIFINQVVIKKQHRLSISLMPYVEYDQPQVEKPVIYLYPETETKVEVKLKVKGALTFTYPEYNDGWEVVAQKDGTLLHNGKPYNYLFWESIQDIKNQDFNEGFLVSNEKTVSFLEEKCSKFGLTSKEQADFITYWGPRLIQNDQNLIHFVLNEKCDQFAELNIDPKPDNVLRFYILFKKAEMKAIAPKEQIIPSMKRTGFTVLEWGGSELQ